MTISVTSPGEPKATAQQKGIAVSCTKRIYVYTKGTVRTEEARMAAALRPFAPKTPMEGPMAAHVRIVFPFSQREARKFIAHLSDDAFLVANPWRPDLDNVLKLLFDTISHLQFWKDDSQVCLLIAEKCRGTTPRIDITIHRLPDDHMARWDRNAVLTGLAGLGFAPTSRPVGGGLGGKTDAPEWI